MIWGRGCDAAIKSPVLRRGTPRSVRGSGQNETGELGGRASGSGGQSR